MRSISLLIYDQESATLNSRAKDPSSNWMTAVKILDDEVFLGAENSYNLFTSRKISTGIGEEEERLEVNSPLLMLFLRLLQPIGQYHLGEYVNAFREGSLVATTNLDSFLRPPVLFGTINGQIGMVLSLPKEKFEFLDRLQTAMEKVKLLTEQRSTFFKVVRPLGMFDHRDYRRFWNERQSKETKNFIDGDLIEQFLDLRKDEMIDVLFSFFCVLLQNAFRFLNRWKLLLTTSIKLWKISANCISLFSRSWIQRGNDACNVNATFNASLSQ